MTADVMTTLRQALEAGCFGHSLPAELDARLMNGELELPLERLGFDSLAWMEFCISVELNTGRELTPVMVTEMALLSDVAGWLGNDGNRP